MSTELTGVFYCIDKLIEYIKRLINLQLKIYVFFIEIILDIQLELY